jgi:organic hydroperoxide reductase OsmC/OhrA
MKTLFTAEAISQGGRWGTIQTPDRLLDVTLGNPLEKGVEKRGPNPELLFAGAYSACYHGALGNAAKKLGTPVRDSTVRALVSLIEGDKGGDRLAVSCMSNFPDSIAPKLNASWMKRTELAPTPERCAATRPSSWWWIDQQNPQTAHDNPFAVSLTAMHKHQKQNATL